MAQPSSPGRILIVGDDDELRETIGAVLVDAGYQVDCASNGKQALERLQRGPLPNLILLDLMMPVMDGWEFRQHQRREPMLASIPTLLLSARIDVGSVATSLGVQGYLTKPIRIAVVVAIISRYCR